MRDIEHSDLEAVKRRLLADPAVLEERNCYQHTPLMYAISCQNSAIALWLIEHRGQHDLGICDRVGCTALHRACDNAPLSVVQSWWQRVRICPSNPRSMARH